MFIENIPGCCTSAILFSFGEHGEDSEVSKKRIAELIETKRHPQYEEVAGRHVMVENGKRCIFAISVDPKNIALLKDYGFNVVDSYEGVQGRVHILTLHLD